MRLVVVSVLAVSLSGCFGYGFGSKAAGESCNGSGDLAEQCQAGLVCVVDAATQTGGTCVAIPEACDDLCDCAEAEALCGDATFAGCTAGPPDTISCDGLADQ